VRGTEEKGRTSTSDYGSRSRSRSGYRKISQSPIEVNTSFEITHKNTENLWNDFKENLRESSQSRHSDSRQPLGNIKGVNISKTAGERFDSGMNIENERLFENNRQANDFSEKFHDHKISYTSNVDTTKFIDTSKSEDKNRLLPEKHLRKLFKVSGEEDK